MLCLSSRVRMRLEPVRWSSVERRVEAGEVKGRVAGVTIAQDHQRGHSIRASARSAPCVRHGRGRLIQQHGGLCSIGRCCICRGGCCWGGLAGGNEVFIPRDGEKEGVVCGVQAIGNWCRFGGGGGRRMVPLLARRVGVIGGALGLKHQTVHGWCCRGPVRSCCMCDGVMAAGISVEVWSSGSRRKGLRGWKFSGSRWWGVYGRMAV